MRVNLRNIPKNDLSVSFTIHKGDSERLEELFTFSDKPLECEMSIKNASEKYWFKGRVKGQLIKPCDYCVEPVSVEIDSEFELLFLDQSQNQFAADYEFTMSDIDTEYLEEYEIDFLKYFEDQIFLETPYVLTCTEDCQGLCSLCGKNLNQARCECERKQTSNSNPFNILKSIVTSEYNASSQEKNVEIKNQTSKNSP